MSEQAKITDCVECDGQGCRRCWPALDEWLGQVTGPPSGRGKPDSVDAIRRLAAGGVS